MYEDYLKSKIRTANIVSFGLTGIAIAYSVFSWCFYPPLTYLPVAGFFLVLFAIFLGFLELHKVFRTIISLVPTLIVVFYHRGLLEGSETPLSSLTLLQGSFALLPFLIFDLREKGFLFLTRAVCFVALVFFRSTEGWLSYGLDDAYFRTGWMHEITVAVAMVFICGSVFIFSLINKRIEKQSQQLLRESDLKNKQLHEQQEETRKNIAKLEEAQAEERKRAWASQGFSEFGALMRQTEELEELYQQLLTGIVKYVGANQAGLYVVEGEGTEIQLALKSCYAYNRRKYKKQNIHPGEGLVGQVYLEKEYIYMTDVPQGYLHITSGLGQATPSALLLIPLMRNETVEGVLEIASFTPFEKHSLNFSAS